MARGRRAAAAEFARLAETLARVADRLEPGGGQADGLELDPEADALSLLLARIDELRRERAAATGEDDTSACPVA